MLYELHDKLRIARVSLRLSQKTVHERTGISLSTIGSYENGKVPPSDNLAKLAAVYNVTTDYLLGIDSEDTMPLGGLDDEGKALLRELKDKMIQYRNENP